MGVSASEPTQLAVQESVTGDVTGSLSAVLSVATREALAGELAELMHQVQEGFGELTAPGEVFKAGEVFDVIDAITINDYLDMRTGEEVAKHIFRLQYPDGRVVCVMQSDARPRRVLARTFAVGRALGDPVVAGPYKYVKKAIKNQIQAAYIFEQQPGFRVRPVARAAQLAA